MHAADAERGNGVTTAYAYDAASRLIELTQNLNSTANDIAFAFEHNAAGQAVEREATSSNSGYFHPAPGTGTANSTPNALNQYSAVGGANYSYDGRGNLTSNGTSAYGYDAHNRLVSAGSASFSYDPIGRLYQSAGAATSRFLYDGAAIVAEYDGANALQRRFVHGPGVDEPIVWYEGSGTSDRRWLVQDRLGSVIAVTDGSGDPATINTYDEYGQPGASNSGRFQYTGQIWLAEATLYHYKARAYAPGIGRFAQTDPILYGAGMNLYAYVGNDPINAIDPLGLQEEEVPTMEDIFVTALFVCWECLTPERIDWIIREIQQVFGAEIARVIAEAAEFALVEGGDRSAMPRGRSGVCSSWFNRERLPVASRRVHFYSSNRTG